MRAIFYLAFIALKKTRKSLYTPKNMKMNNKHIKLRTCPKSLHYCFS